MTDQHIDETLNGLSLLLAWIALFGAIWAEFGLAPAFIVGASVRLLGQIITHIKS